MAEPHTRMYLLYYFSLPSHTLFVLSVILVLFSSLLSPVRSAFSFVFLPLSIAQHIPCKLQVAVPTYTLCSARNVYCQLVTTFCSTRAWRRSTTTYYYYCAQRRGLGACAVEAPHQDTVLNARFPPSAPSPTPFSGTSLGLFPSHTT